MTELAAEQSPAHPKRESRLRRLARSLALLRESPIGMAGAFLVVFWLVMAITAPILPLKPPLAQDAGAMLVPWLTQTADGTMYWLGTDDRGRDVLSRLIWGSRLVLFWAGLATIVA
jgi:peptide/nickel transport system permease protein